MNLKPYITNLKENYEETVFGFEAGAFVGFHLAWLGEVTSIIFYQDMQNGKREIPDYLIIGADKENYNNGQQTLKKLDSLEGMVGPEVLANQTPNTVLEKLGEAQDYMSSPEGLLGQHYQGLEQHIEKAKEETEYFVSGWPENTKEWNAHLSANPFQELQTTIEYRKDEQLDIMNHYDGIDISIALVPMALFGPFIACAALGSAIGYAADSLSKKASNKIKNRNKIG